MQWKKLIKAASLTAFSAFLLMSAGTITGNAEKVVNQHGSAVNYYHRGYSDVYNKNTSTHYNYYDDYNGGSLKSNAGKYVNFEPYMNIDVESPQSIVVTPNHKIFVASNYQDEFHGNLEVYKFNGPQDQNPKVGPSFKGGHGQSLTYNPRTNQLWLIGNKSGASQVHSNAQEISPFSLKPLRKINFSFAPSIISSNLAFDKNGNAYTYTIAHGGFAPAGSVKLYKGRITNHSVHFNLVKQGIRHAAGDIPQAMSYNPKNNRLYLVSDGEFISFPANKIGHLSRKDVQYSKFPGHLEFEGLAFDKSGHGYLLVHGEILRSTNVF